MLSDSSDLKLMFLAALNTSIVNVLNWILFSLSVVLSFFNPFLVMSAGDFLAFFTAMGMLVKPAKDP